MGGGVCRRVCVGGSYSAWLITLLPACIEGVWDGNVSGSFNASHPSSKVGDHPAHDSPWPAGVGMNTLLHIHTGAATLFSTVSLQTN